MLGKRGISQWEIKAKHPGSSDFRDPVYEYANLIPEFAFGDGCRAKNVDWDTLQRSDQKTKKMEIMRKMRNR
jgi:hypothetical protein